MNQDIRIGNQTAFSAAQLMHPLEFAIAQGFQAFEWFSDKKQHPDGSSGGWDEDDMDAAQRDHIRQLGEQHGIRYTVHAPWQANPLQPGGEELLRRSVDFARDIGADLVNLHLYLDRGPEGYAEALAPVVAYAAEQGVRISIENTPETGPADFNRTFDCLKDRVGDLRHLGMCLDIGHANLFAETRNDFIRYLDELANELPIIHLHVHENWGDNDSHLTLFTGPAAENDQGIRSLVERLHRRGYTGAMIMEQWPDPPELLRSAEEHLQQILDQTRGARKQAEPEIADTPEPEPRPEIGSAPEPKPLEMPVADLPQRELALIDHIAEAHERNTSWRQRLQWIEEEVGSPEFEARPGDLALLAIYLRFLGTGEVVCEEDGRHFRPNHHARAALAIETRLEEAAAAETQWILRKIYPWLPSYSASFQRREPLTRIRDIAHRNDIPQELKREIKQRLQNKLHRCAGPEDLETSSELLERVTGRAADYSPEFIEQFRIFHQELSEFFNATTLEQRLGQLLPSLAPEPAEQVRDFLELKREYEQSGRTPLALLDQLSLLRRGCLGQLAGAEGETAQQLRLTDIALEDYAFALLSEAANGLESLESADDWRQLLEALRIALSNIGLSRLEVEETEVLISELEAWGRDFSADDPFHLRRLKASLERAARIADRYSQQVLELFPPRVDALGQKLGVERQAIRVFSEGDIRGNVVFQLTRLLEGARKAIRQRLQLPPWESIGPGQARAQLADCTSLPELSEREQPLILLLEQAEGDEEVPLNVRGILLAHPIPHLSHLGVRARQAGIPFACSEQTDPFAPFQTHLKQPVELTVGDDGVSLEPASAASDKAAAAPAPAAEIRLPAADIEGPGTPLPLLEAVSEKCGAKAATAAELLRLAEGSGSGLFQAPKGLVLPFAAMQWSLGQVPERERRYRERIEALNSADPEQLSSRLEAIRELITELPVAPEVVKEVRDLFGGDTPVAVRSSANGEDLEELASAGLYDSIIGVSGKACEEAVCQVWASLWNRRAFISRQQNRIPHDAIHMAVLIQEMLDPELSFVMHTTDPVSGDKTLCRVEVAVGLGETLVSAAQPGNAYRLNCNRTTGETQLLSCASFPMALRYQPGRGVVETRIDYSQIPLSADPSQAQRLGERFGRIANALEEAFARPQDAEGVLIGDTVHLVQTRPQQGV